MVSECKTMQYNTMWVPWLATMGMGKGKGAGEREMGSERKKEQSSSNDLRRKTY